MRDSRMRNRHSGPGTKTIFRGYGHCSDHVGETLQVAAVTKPKPPPDQLEDLLGWLLANMDAPVPAEQTSGPQIRQRPIRRDRNDVGCFSCGKSGHAATRCPALDKSFPFMLPGWRAESTLGGFIMISPSVTAKRLRTENGD